MRVKRGSNGVATKHVMARQRLQLRVIAVNVVHVLSTINSGNPYGARGCTTNGGVRMHLGKTVDSSAKCQ
jgi:hypothetical protein